MEEARVEVEEEENNSFEDGVSLRDVDMSFSPPNKRNLQRLPRSKFVKLLENKVGFVVYY